MARWHGVRGRASDRGAAAVEFALVVPVLFLLIFGILDYGRFFFDSISLRQGAREGARQAVVQNYAASCTGTVGAKIACSAKIASDSTIGTPLVYIPAVTWKQGNQLLVCMLSKERGTGFVPFPAGGILKTKVYMSIEVAPSPAIDVPLYQDSIPADSLPATWLDVDGNPWCS